MKKYLKPFAAMTGALMAVMGVMSVAPLAQAAGNVVPDPGFRTCLNTRYFGQADTTDITAAQLATLTTVDCFPSGIRSLEGAEYLTNVTHLSIEGGLVAGGPIQPANQFSDVSPLATLTKLTYLNLSTNGITDVSPLATLTNLTYLDLDFNQMTDVSPLGHLTKLTELHLDLNPQISDVSSLGTLTNLTSLSIKQQVVKPGLLRDVSAVGKMTNLTRLDLDGNQISDVTPLGTLTKLTFLDLDGNHVTDLSPLNGVTGLIQVPSTVLAGSQTVTTSGAGGVPLPLPVVTPLTDAGNPVTWKVVSGAATLIGDTVTVASPTVVVSWVDAIGQFAGQVTVTRSGCQPFIDVPASNTFAGSICWASAAGLTYGTGDGTTYSPSRSVNRASMAEFLYRLAGSPAWEAPLASPFVDVAPTDMFYKAITWLYNQKITVGVQIGGKLYYQPGNAVNRGSMAAFLYRLSGRPTWTAPLNSAFTDVRTTNTFYSSIHWLYDQRITVGVPTMSGLSYQPGNPVNRWSMAAFMHRLATKQLQCTPYPGGIGC